MATATAHRGKKKDCPICKGTGVQSSMVSSVNATKIDGMLAPGAGECMDCGKAVCDERKQQQQDVTLKFEITKASPDRNLVFGWASIVEEDGTEVVDLQDDIISADDLEEAAYEFNLNARNAGEMHERIVGKLVESVVMTVEKQTAMGIDLGRVGWWVGWKVDPDVFELVKNGTYKAFSIGGRGKRADA